MCTRVCATILASQPLFPCTLSTTDQGSTVDQLGVGVRPPYRPLALRTLRNDRAGKRQAQANATRTGTRAGSCSATPRTLPIVVDSQENLRSFLL